MALAIMLGIHEEKKRSAHNGERSWESHEAAPSDGESARATVWELS